jgi:hypothetical protein
MRLVSDFFFKKILVLIWKTFCKQVTLEVKGETQLKNLAEKLEAAGVRHKLWIEQPENIPTCIATAPCPKSQVASFFRKLKLCK